MTDFVVPIMAVAMLALCVSQAYLLLYCRYLHRRVAELSGRHVRVVFHPDASAAAMAELRRATAVYVSGRWITND